MMRDPVIDLVTLSDAYAGHLGLSHWRVSYLARGDGQFFQRLRSGAGCTVRTQQKVLTWFADNWPADLDWPSDIPRPDPRAEVA